MSRHTAMPGDVYMQSAYFSAPGDNIARVTEHKTSRCWECCQAVRYNARVCMTRATGRAR